MKLGMIGRVWLAFQAGKFVKTVYEERQAYHQRMSNFHGYSWPQVEHILSLCCQAVPNMHSELQALPEDRKLAILKGIFTVHPAKFRAQFGFDRPPPG